MGRRVGGTGEKKNVLFCFWFFGGVFVNLYTVQGWIILYRL